MTCIVGNRIVRGNLVQTVEITTAGGKIADIRPLAGEQSGTELPLVLPGFIDLHVHGGGGADTMDGTPEALATIARTHAKFGTTALLATTVTDHPDRIDAVLSAVKTFVESNQHSSSQILGVHLEGPFIHPSKAGAQCPDWIANPNPKLAHGWFARGVVRMLTLAPELPQAFEIARMAAGRGIVVAAGHTTASAQTMELARQAGFSHVTHLCNAMPAFHHREIGPIGQVVADPAYTADVICDGLHVHPIMLTTLVRAIGDERLLLITDAMRAVAMGPGVYQLGDLPVHVEEGQCRLADGTLAGSLLTMDEAFWRMHEVIGVTLESAQRMACANPAAKLKLARKGKLEAGYDADIIAFDSSRKLLWTMVNGEYVYRRSC